MRVMLAIALFMAAYAHAGYIDSQGREWLRLPATWNTTWTEVAEACSSLTGQCVGVLEDRPIYSNGVTNIDLTGYHWASRVELVSMLEEFYAPINNTGITEAPGSVGEALFSELPDTYGTGDGWVVMNGWTRDVLYRDGAFFGGMSYVVYQATHKWYPDEPWTEFHMTSASMDYRDISIGAWVYRKIDVPEPGSLGLLAAALLAVALHKLRTTSLE